MRFPSRRRPVTFRPITAVSGGSTVRSRNGLFTRTRPRRSPTTRVASAAMYTSTSGSSGTAPMLAPRVRAAKRHHVACGPPEAGMGKEFFHRDIQLFMDHRVDWARYFRLRDGDAVHPEDEVETYRTILRTVGEICEDLEAGALEHWHEEVRLESGQVVVPPHISAGYAKLRQASMLCLVLPTEYGGYGLPALLNCAYLEMLARADPSL